jgi:hypothetical protein
MSVIEGCAHGTRLCQKLHVTVGRTLTDGLSVGEA